MKRFAVFWRSWDCELQMSQARKLTPFTEHRLAALMRVSTNPQETKAQLARLRHYYRNAGLEFPPAEWLIEEKISAFRDNALEKRTGLTRLVEASESHEIRGFACVRVSRFFRNTGLGKTIYTRLQRVGARLVFAEYPSVDVFTTTGYKWLINELAGAETWSLDHALRVRDGKTAKHERGETNATHPGFGAKSKRGVLRWVKSEAIIVRDALRMLHDEDKSPRIIALELSKKYAQHFTRQTIVRWIKSPRYYGLVRHTPTPHGKMGAPMSAIRASRLRRAKWKGLVPRRWFNENHLIMQSHAKNGRGIHDQTTHKYLYGNRFLSCSKCGGSLYADMRLGGTRDGVTRNVAGYLCSNHRKGLCDVGSAAINEGPLTAQFAEIISAIKLPDDWKAMVLEQSRKAKTSTDLAAAKLRGLLIQREKAAREFASTKDMLAFTGRLAELDKLESSIKSERSHFSDSQFSAISRELENIPAMLGKATNEERAKILRRIFARVEVDVKLKKITRFELFPSACILLQNANGFERVQEGIFVSNSRGDIDERILAALRDLGGEAMAFQIVEKSGLPHDVVRLRLRTLHGGGLIELRGNKNVQEQKSKRVKVWGIVTRQHND